MLSRADFDRYDRQVRNLASGAGDYVRRMVGAYMGQYPDASVAECREFARQAMEEAVSVYGDASATAAADLYDSQMDTAGNGAPRALLHSGVDMAQVEKVARYQADKLVKGDTQGFVRECAAYASDATKRAANDTMLVNAKRDGKRKVRFARVPTGAETCTFCRMLASRGFVYKSDKSAGKFSHFHRGCDCRIVASTDSEGLEGYDPDRELELWRKFDEIDHMENLTRAERDRLKREAFSGIESAGSNADVVEAIKNQHWFNEHDYNGQPFNSMDGITFVGMDLAAAKSVYRSYEKFFNRFPKLKGELNAYNAGDLLDDSTYGFTIMSGDRGGGALNTRFYSNYAKLLRRYQDDVRNGFHPQGTTADAIVVRELGHSIDNYLTVVHGLGESKRGKCFSAQVRKLVLKKLGLKVKDLSSEVSVYANDKKAPNEEFFAECIAEYVESPTPRRVAWEVGKIVEETLDSV